MSIGAPIDRSDLGAGSKGRAEGTADCGRIAAYSFFLMPSEWAKRWGQNNEKGMAE
ncbi:hypothetical protein TBK1r_09160 [Stieleria magnilauensis]|uniref:Uncharacterized protein n=1 Tax=Stieleria magnilauensis TaxID=2527963 RepID=A0ABX5XMZ4_9BACT|nr:hypothetical protein TBK1r_09160 [Planctomycetes bacterium TBK1r]